MTSPIRSSSHQIGSSSNDDDVDNLEKFFTKMKTPSRSELKRLNNPKPITPMNKFIVPDGPISDGTDGPISDEENDFEKTSIITALKSSPFQAKREKKPLQKVKG